MGSVINWVKGIFVGGGGFAAGNVVSNFALKSFSVLSVGVIYIAWATFTIFTMTTVFSLLNSAANTLQQPSLAVVGSILDVLGLVKPDNFTQCVSIVVGLSVTKFALRVYMLIWSKLYHVAFMAATSK